jgi:anti-sigma factor RsiW
MAYLDGELSASERTAFDAHLAVCPDCVRYMNTYKATTQLAREALLSDDSVDDNVPSSLVAAILKLRKRS